jgi:hypothetical protein
MMMMTVPELFNTNSTLTQLTVHEDFTVYQRHEGYTKHSNIPLQLTHFKIRLDGKINKMT